jgi:ACT domain-containing protein
MFTNAMEWAMKIRSLEQVKRTYSINEAADLLGIGRNAAYAAAGRDFPVITIGKRKVVPKAALDRMLGIEGESAA